MTYQRPLLFFLLFAVLTLSIGGYRQAMSKVSGVGMNQSIGDKLAWKNQFDVVVAGDSRTYRGISPEYMQQRLPNYKIANFGFSNAGFGDAFLNRVESLLRSDSRHKIIVLGITPNSLTQEAAVINNQFLDLTRQDPRNLWILKTFGSVFDFFEPIKSYEIKPLLTASKNGYYQNYHPDGWVASYKIPEITTEALPMYQALWSKTKVSPAVIDNLLTRVSQWHAQGIQVFAFAPPTSSAMWHLETSQSGFHEPDFQNRFTQAGGTWLSVPPTAFHTYDGGHLRQDAAAKLSLIVARGVAKEQGALVYANKK